MSAAAVAVNEVMTTESLARPRFRDAWMSEWSKLISWPAGRRLVAVAAVLAIAGSAAFVLSSRITTGRNARELDLHDRLTVSLLGADLANVTLIVLTVLAVSGELSSGMSAVTLQTTPRRGRVFCAKVLALLALGSLVSIGSTLLAFLSGQLALRAQGVPWPSLAEPGLVRLVAGTMLMIPFYVLVAACLAFCCRSGSVAFVGVFLVMCLPSLAKLLPTGAATAALWVLPTSSLHTLAGISVPGDRDYTAPGIAILVLLAWVALLGAVAFRRFRRRDL